MAGFGGFAGGLSKGLLDTWRLQDDQKRLALQEERDKRLNDAADLQLEETRRKIAEAQDEKAFETDAAKVMAEIGTGTKPSVGGVEAPTLADAEQMARQNNQANLRAFDNALAAEGKPPAELRPHEIEGGTVFGKAQADRKLADLSGKYTSLGAGKAQEIIRRQHARRAYDIIEKAATLPDSDEALQMVVHAIDDIPDGRRVIGQKMPDGTLRVGYRDEATGAPVGKPQIYASADDFLHRYLAKLSPDSLLTYYRDNVKAKALDDRLEARLQAQSEALDRRLAAVGAKSGGSGGSRKSGGGGADESAEDPKQLNEWMKLIKEIVPEGGEASKDAEGNETAIPPERLRANTLEYVRRIASHNAAVPNSAAVNAAYEIAAGRAMISPEIDGNTHKVTLVAAVGPNKYVVDPDIASRVGDMTDSTGNPLMSPEGVKRMYWSALQGSAVANPVQFASAWQIANDPGKLAEVQARAAKGDGQAKSALAAAEIVRRGIEGAQALTVPTKADDATQPAPFVPTEAERASAKKLGVDPDRTSLADDLSSAWNKITSTAGTAADAAGRNTVRNTIGLARARGLRFPEAAALYDALKDHPEYRDELTQEELDAVQVAVKKRL